ncbi:MAG TPA: inorganic pyrophosphatase [Solibacterales bacterium]|nr:inorganic pyrophosphatase [Bryobacterales bacterium]
MSNLLTLPHRLDKKNATCQAIIETPKGSRNKYDFDPAAGLFCLAKLLPEGMVFPYDFGFVPSTVAPDGDPVDVMLFMDEPVPVGCLVPVRLIGVIEGEQTEDEKTTRNDRLVAVAIHSHTHQKTESLKQVNPRVTDEVEQFFVYYNELQQIKFRVLGQYGPNRAVQLVEKGAADFRKKAEKKKGK